MTPLTATEAISPAVEHAKTLLRPFSLKLWLKLGLVALIAEAGAQFLFPPLGNHAPASAPSGIGAASGGLTSAMVAVFIVIGVIALLLGLAFFYLSSRLQLVLMDMVATRTTLVAPVWHRTASRTWRWIGFKVVTYLAIFLVAGAILVVPLLYFLRSLPRGNAQPAPAFFGTFVLVFLMVFVVFFVILLAIWSTRDFVLPFLLFEDQTVGDAVRSAWSLFRREPGSFLFYLFMKFVLCLVAGIVAEFCIALYVLVLCLPIGGVAAALWFLLHQSGPFTTAIMYTSFALLGLVFLAAVLGAILCISCAVLIFYQAYTLYFLGGRIPVIGNLLQPQRPEPPPFGPPLTPVLS
ncbi:MAG TPA: hypothetical protein VNY74_08125 [Edaphobacter sp.]|jgi:hypothetical protein|nr:hypothetical protein [Edaphobacter sp.]